jgi:hypothetical protein
MAITCLLTFVLWNKTARLAMRLLFLLALVVGGTGFYLHNHGHLRQVLKISFNAWTDPQMSHSQAPPQFAALAFAGLGVIGILASLKRFNS